MLVRMSTHLNCSDAFMSVNDFYSCTGAGKFVRSKKSQPGFEVGISCTESEPAAPVAIFVFKHSGLEREELPFPLSFCPTATEISLSLGARGIYFGQAEEPEETLDEYVCGVSLKAWTFLITWALNSGYTIVDKFWSTPPASIGQMHRTEE